MILSTCSRWPCWMPRLWNSTLTRSMRSWWFQIRGLPNLPEYEWLGLLCCDLENTMYSPPCLANIVSCNIENRYFHVWWFELNQFPKGVVHFWSSGSCLRDSGGVSTISNEVVSVQGFVLDWACWSIYLASCLTRPTFIMWLRRWKWYLIVLLRWRIFGRGLDFLV